MQRALVTLIVVWLLCGVSACSSNNPGGSEQAPTASTGGSTFKPEIEGSVVKSDKYGQQIRVGQAVAIVAASEPKFSRGVGIKGHLALTSGNCIGFALRPIEGPPDGSAVINMPAHLEVVIVWPPGTTFSTEGGKVTVTSEGKKVRVGDTIEGGSSLSYDLRALRGLLPKGCRNSRLQQVGLGS